MSDSYSEPCPDLPDGSNDAEEQVLDRALAGAFERSEAPREPFAGAPSVLDRVQELTGQRPGVALREADGGGPTPMLKPLGPDQELRTGKYVVHGEIGRGGVGAVHRGHDQELGRDVAMKVLHERFAADAGILHRFVEEAQIGGQLQHPGIVPVYDLGMRDGRPFFTMKLVKGETLAKRLADRVTAQDDRRSFLGIFEDICQTLAYAHARGVVHRDLKPANVMIGSFGEVQVVDWGMGKVLQRGGMADERLAAQRQSQLSVIETVRSSDTGTQSLVGSVMGTPAYMPPEQARGDVDAMDERSDVFALGAILCEILTGAPPYVGATNDLIAMAAMAKLDDAHARLAACGAEPQMVELTQRCLMPSPAARPRSAAEVAKAIHDHLSAVERRVHEARVEAAEARVRAAALRRTQRLGVALTVAIAAGLLVSLWFWREASEQRERAVVAADSERKAAAAAEEQRRLAAARADQLQQVVDFQSDQFRSVVPRVMGAYLHDAIVAAVPADDRDDLEPLLGHVNFTDVGLQALRRQLFEPSLEEVDSRFDGQPLVQAQLLTSMASSMSGLGLSREAREPATRGAALFAAELGEHDPQAVDAKLVEASVLERLSEFARAERLFREALDARRDALGPDHPDTLDAWTDLCTVLVAYGDPDKAALECDGVLAAQRRVRGSEHPGTLRALLTRAGLHRSQSELPQAEACCREALAGYRRVSGGASLEALRAAHKLGAILRLQQKDLEAESLLRPALADSRRVNGDAHPLTLDILNSLAVLLLGTDRKSEAESLLREARDGYRAALGDDDRGTLVAQRNLAMLLIDRGEFAEAERLVRRAQEGYARTYGPDNAQTLMLRTDGARLLHGQQRYDEAEREYREALQHCRRELGDRHEATLIALEGLARTLAASDRPAEAAQCYRELYERRVEVQGGDHVESLRVRLWLAQALRHSRQHVEAESITRALVDRAAAELGAEHQTTLAVLSLRGDALTELGRAQEAQPLLEQALAAQRSQLGDEHAATVDTIAALGRCAMALGDDERAALLLREALEQQRLHNAPRSVVALSINRLGVVLQRLGRYAEAEQLFREALAMREAQAGPDHRNTISASYNVGFVLFMQGRHADAVPFLERGFVGFRRVLGDGHSTTLGAWNMLAMSLRDAGQHERAEGVFGELLAALAATKGRGSAEFLRARIGLAKTYVRLQKWQLAMAALTEVELAARDGDAAVRRLVVQAMVELFEAWHRAAPGEGHDEQAAAWRERG